MVRSTATRGTAVLFVCLILTAASPAALAVPDVDGDGYHAGIDCNDNDPTVWFIPGETDGLLFAPNKTGLSWSPPAIPGGTPAATRYDTLRARFAYDFACDDAVCTAADVLPTSSSDPSIPPVGGAYFYLSRASNSCGTGTIGMRSNGAQRAALTGDCEDLCNLSNSGFDRGLTGWILENCSSRARSSRTTRCTATPSS
jgi:hypothetical protein